MSDAEPTHLDPWTKLLNRKQLEAYLADGHCAVLAGPGSGKTRVLTAKVARLVSQKAIGPRGVACVTFNNDTVREMRTRLADLGFRPSKRLFVGTVHSFCTSCIVTPFGHLFREDLAQKLTVATEQQQLLFLQEAMAAENINGRLDDWRTPFAIYRRTHPFKDLPEWFEDHEMANLITTYEDTLHRRGLIDFDDMVLIALDLIRRHEFVRSALEARFPFLVIDEYQDLGYPLHLIVRLLMESTDIEVFAVGDPDQSIYSFAGANPQYLRELANDTGVMQVQLDMNYRSAQEIIDSSQVALAVSPPRNYESARKGASGELRFVECPSGIGEQARSIANHVIPTLEKEGVARGQIAILYIDRADAKILTEALEEGGIKFAGERDQRYRRSPFTRWLEDVAVWCSLFPNTQQGPDFDDLFRWYAEIRETAGVPVGLHDLAERTELFEKLTYIADQNMPLDTWLLQLNACLDLMNCLAALADNPGYLSDWNEINRACSKDGALNDFKLEDFASCGGGKADTVTITTLHSSKGLEYEAVIMPGLEQGRLPGYRATSPGALQEARRVFYVGMTRAKDTVYLLYSGWYQTRFGTTYNNGPSQFVQELLARSG